MLTLAHRRSGYMRPGLNLSGAAEIQNLQRALANLAIATQRPMINASVTGVIDDQTMTAINAALGLLTEELKDSTWIYVGLQAALIAGASTATAKEYVAKYAPQLTMAANTAAVKYRVAPTPPPVIMPVQAGFFAPGWYKTPLGIALIAGAAFVGYKVFIAK